VEEVVRSTNAADAAGLAVELLLFHVVVKEAALQAGVCAKVNPAAAAGGSDRLPEPAECAHQLTHGCAVKLMALAWVLLNRDIDVSFTCPL
jgi:hypothetical protein